MNRPALTPSNVKAMLLDAINSNKTRAQLVIDHNILLVNINSYLGKLLTAVDIPENNKVSLSSLRDLQKVNSGRVLASIISVSSTASKRGQKGLQEMKVKNINSETVIVAEENAKNDNYAFLAKALMATQNPLVQHQPVGNQNDNIHIPMNATEQYVVVSYDGMEEFAVFDGAFLVNLSTSTMV